LRTALAQTERLSLLVIELLDLSGIDEGARRLRVSSFDVGTFVDEAVAEATVAATAAGRGVTFASSVEPVGACATGDRERLTLVVLNLLDNAARHSSDDGKVVIAARADQGGLVIDVVDDGPGIAPEERERVFERFTRGERASGGGTGLGLAIARWVVRLHGGTIHVSDAHPDAVRPGCLIRVTLPTAPGSAPTLDTAAA
jgi:signal transduction histidine kinase